jgi:hypothetical protein
MQCTRSSYLLRGYVIVYLCLKALVNALGGDGGEVAVGEDAINDSGVGRLYFWRKSFRSILSVIGHNISIP